MAADVGIEATAVGAWAMPEPDDDETDQAGSDGSADDDS